MLPRTILLACTISIYSTNISFAQDSKIDAAVEVVRSLCLVGSEYNIEADATGNIRILSTKPSGEGSLNFNVRQAEGNPINASDDLRIIADREVRECTANHIGRIIDAIFSESPPPIQDTQNKNYDTLRSARFIGYIPETIRIEDFLVKKNDKYYYRFSVSKPSKVTIAYITSDKVLYVGLYNSEGEVISSPDQFGRNSKEVRRLYPGDYIVSVSAFSGAAVYFVLDVYADSIK